MNDRTRHALAVLAVALILGITGDVLRTWVPGRLDLALWATVALLLATVLVHRGALPRPPQAGWLAACAALLIPCLVWRDAEQLLALNVMGLLGVVTLAAAAAATSSLGRLGVFDLGLGAATLGLHAAAGPIPAAVGDVSWGALPLGARARRVALVCAGLVAATPVILIFGALFGDADPFFRQTMARLFRWDLEAIVEHLAFAGFVTWAVAGALRGALWREGRKPLVTLPSGGMVPAGAILGFVGGIGALFALFIGFQARELFLDSTEFQALTGVTISEYARQGFFELIAVAALTLPMLLGADWLLARQDQTGMRWFHRITVGVLVLLALVLASACQRMLLYLDYYGLTEQRFYALVFMAYLALLGVWFAATVLRDRRLRFVPGALVAGYATLLLLNVVNPDAVVAGVNLRRAEQGAPLDTAYLGGLSADAVPTLAAALAKGGVPDGCALEAKLRGRWVGGGENATATEDWSLSRRRAARVLGALPPRPECAQLGG